MSYDGYGLDLGHYAGGLSPLEVENVQPFNAARVRSVADPSIHDLCAVMSIQGRSPTLDAVAYRRIYALDRKSSGSDLGAGFQLACILGDDDACAFVQGLIESLVRDWEAL